MGPPENPILRSRLSTVLRQGEYHRVTRTAHYPGIQPKLQEGPTARFSGLRRPVTAARPTKRAHGLQIGFKFEP